MWEKSKRDNLNTYNGLKIKPSVIFLVELLSYKWLKMCKITRPLEKAYKITTVLRYRRSEI